MPRFFRFIQRYLKHLETGMQGMTCLFHRSAGRLLAVALIGMFWAVPALTLSGQTADPDWIGSSPAVYNIEVGKTKGQVIMQYFLLKGNKTYYWRSNNPARKFDEELNISEKDEFRVKVEFRLDPKGPQNSRYALEIPSESWVTTEDCFIEPKVLNFPMRALANGHLEFPLKLSAGCDKSSKIKLDFRFVDNGKVEKFNISDHFGNILHRKTDQYNTRIEIPIKVHDSRRLAEVAQAKAPEKATEDIAPKTGALIEKATTTAPAEQPVSPRRTPEEWMTDTLETIALKHGKLIDQIAALEMLQDAVSSPVRKELVRESIAAKVKIYFDNYILATAVPSCEEELTIKFGETPEYAYLDEADRKRYEDYKTACESKQNAEKRAFNAAKNNDTVKAYEAYRKAYPQGKYVAKADSRIEEIKNIDKEAWTDTEQEAGKTEDPCRKAALFDAYLKNSIHHTNYRVSAERERKKASEHCNDFRIESVRQDAGDGVYVLEVKNGEKPYTGTAGIETLRLKIDGTKITVKVLEEGDYPLTVTDRSGKSASYTINAVSPDLMLIVEEEKIVVRGGRGPFYFEVKDMEVEPYLLQKGREISSADLCKALGMKTSFDYLIRDVDGNLSGVETMSIGAGSKPFPVGRLLLAALLLAVAFALYRFRNKLSTLLPNIKTKEDRQWERALQAKTRRSIEAYEEQYPDGKYIANVPGIKEDIETWDRALEASDLSIYTSAYPEGIFKEEVGELEKEIERWEECRESGRYSHYLEEYPAGHFAVKAKESMMEQKDNESRKEKQLRAPSIDIHLPDQENTEAQSESNTVGPVVLPATGYYTFHLNTHWADTLVQQVWMSKEACQDAYFLIEDATRAAFMQKDTIPEVGGFLLGVPHRNEDDTFDVRIEKFVSVKPQNNGEYEITFGREAFIQLDDALEKDKSLTTVGWMHTHPGHGLFLSGKDLEVVEAFFREPYHLSMEVDTKTRHLDTAFFTRRKDRQLNNSLPTSNAKAWFSWA
ncbi:MAG: hypothetical protein KDD15_17960, partial [Lewinella sp.]|nr:hypothetical protein [Lewinella sp.]